MTMFLICVRFQNVGNLVTMARGSIKPEQFIRFESVHQAFSDQVRCGVTWSASKDPDISVVPKNLFNRLNDSNRLACPRSKKF